MLCETKPNKKKIHIFIRVDRFIYEKVFKINCYSYDTFYTSFVYKFGEKVFLKGAFWTPSSQESFLIYCNRIKFSYM